MITWKEKEDNWGQIVLTAFSNGVRIASVDFGRTCRLRAAWVSKRDYYGKSFTIDSIKEQVEKEWYEWIKKAGLREDV